MNDIATTKLESAIACFQGVRTKISEGMKHLYDIAESKLWDNGQYSSFGEFVEEGCGISESLASKLLKIYKHYAVEGGIEYARLSNTDSEKLYLAIGLPGTPEEKLNRAEMLTRRDIKDSLAVKDGVECTHDTLIQICAHCGRKVS